MEKKKKNKYREKLAVGSFPSLNSLNMALDRLYMSGSHYSYLANRAYAQTNSQVRTRLGPMAVGQERRNGEVRKRVSVNIKAKTNFPLDCRSQFPSVSTMTTLSMVSHRAAGMLFCAYCFSSVLACTLRGYTMATLAGAIYFLHA